MWRLRAGYLPLLALVAVMAGVPTVARGGSPKQAIAVVMDEYSFEPATLTVSAGVPVELTLENRGKLPHEFMAYPATGIRMKAGRPDHEWVEENSLLRSVEARIESEGIAASGHVFEVLVNPGARATLRFVPEKAGTFEFACLIAGHYERGQKGRLVVR